MSNLNEVVEEIKAAPTKFNQLIEQERYCEAKWLFYDCVKTAAFLELDNMVMEQLFGEQDVILIFMSVRLSAILLKMVLFQHQDIT